jgi:hypothetical protein
VVGIEPTSKNPSSREHYVCSRIRASDGCEVLVKTTKLGGFNRCPDARLELSFPTSPARSLPTFCYRCRPLSKLDNLRLCSHCKFCFVSEYIWAAFYWACRPTQTRTQSFKVPVETSAPPRLVVSQHSINLCNWEYLYPYDDCYYYFSPDHFAIIFVA